jgi:hypothetical protein
MRKSQDSETQVFHFFFLYVKPGGRKGDMKVEGDYQRRGWGWGGTVIEDNGGGYDQNMLYACTKMSGWS